MLTPERMGCLALAILWVNTLLIAAVAAKRVRALVGLGRRAVVARGRVLCGDGPGGALAAHRVEQVGRAAAGAGAILFHDRGAAGEVFGGTVALEGGGELAVPAARAAEVWVDAASLESAAACASSDDFDRAYASASKARGFARTVVALVGEGAQVFVSRPADGEGLLVSTFDPRALLAKKAALGAAFLAAELLAAAGCTALALRPPLFGTVSTVGGALGLGFFLLVQPAGTRVRDALLVPSRAPLRGRWARAELPDPAHAEPAA